MPLYKKLAPKIRELKTLRSSNGEIATKLKLSRKTIRKCLMENLNINLANYQIKIFIKFFTYIFRKFLDSKLIKIGTVENGHIIEQKPHYQAHSNIESLALLDQENKGANWYEWRTRSQPIRTLALMPVKIKIAIEQREPLYKKLAPKIRELKVFRKSINEIAKTLKISPKTIRKSLSNN